MTLERCSCRRNVALLTAGADVEQLGTTQSLRVTYGQMSSGKSVRSAHQTSEGGDKNMVTPNVGLGQMMPGWSQGQVRAITYTEDWNFRAVRHKKNQVNQEVLFLKSVCNICKRMNDIQLLFFEALEIYMHLCMMC